LKRAINYAYISPIISFEGVDRGDFINTILTLGEYDEIVHRRIAETLCEGPS
jgi:hypothetical protein